jgi:hypothetical protein
MSTIYTQIFVKPTANVSLYQITDPTIQKQRSEFVSNLKQEGIIVDKNTISEDELTLTFERIFKDRDSYNSYINNTIITQSWPARDAYNKSNEITLTESVVDSE